MNLKELRQKIEKLNRVMEGEELDMHMDEAEYKLEGIKQTIEAVDESSIACFGSSTNTDMKEWQKIKELLK